MFGEYRVPDIIKSIDTKTRSYCESIEQESVSVRQIINDINNENSKKATLGDLAVDMGDFEQFMSETKDRGFSYE
jgi:hypothetical protein